MSMVLTGIRVGKVVGALDVKSDRSIETIRRTPTRVMFVYAMWAMVWYEPDWFVAALGGGTFLVKLYALMFLPICIMLAQHARREAFFWPYLLILAVHVVWLPFVLNRGLLLNQLGKYVQYCVLYSVTVSVLDTPRQVLTLVKLFLFHFVWFGLQGLGAGKVEWHHNLGDENSYGALMSVGFGYSFYLAMGINEKKYRNWAALVCFLCVAGVVLSFARGVMISLCVVFGAIALRTPRKLFFLGFGTIVALIGLVVIQVAYPNGEYWDEMLTITEGTEGGTGLHRWVLWTAGWTLFTMSPILGVGPGNFGANAAEYYLTLGVTNLGSTFDDPAKMWGYVLHNDFLSVLVEQGVIGFIGFMAVLVYFHRSTRFLRADPIRKLWQKQTGGFIDSSSLALGLEAAMIGFLMNSIFYPHYYMSWFWSLVMLALVSVNVTKRVMAESLNDPIHPAGNVMGVWGGSDGRLR